MACIPAVDFAAANRAGPGMDLPAPWHHHHFWYWTEMFVVWAVVVLILFGHRLAFFVHAAAAFP